jgi:hypothetical protein
VTYLFSIQAIGTPNVIVSTQQTAAAPFPREESEGRFGNRTLSICERKTPIATWRATAISLYERERWQADKALSGQSRARLDANP